MTLISAEGISRRYGDHILFENIRFSVADGDRLALIGANGSGKSTLLKILADLDSPDEGKISKRRDLTVAYLSQDPLAETKGDILEVVFSATDELTKAVKAFQVAKASSTGLEEATLEMDRLKAWSHEAKAKQVLSKLGIEDFEQKVETLSGGQRKRVAIAQALIGDPDLLIMDEPTNHLDIEAIEWLEKYLAKEARALILVTHDRFFLDRVTNEILELEHGSVMRFRGDYAYYLAKKAEHDDQKDQEVTKAKNLLRKELEWARRMPKARTTKSKARLQSLEGLKTKATGRVKAGDIKLEVTAKRLGGTILEVEEISKAFGEIKILDDFSYTFRKGERLGIVGPNGVGKTTVIEILTGDQKPDKGKILKGDNTKFGYYRQRELIFDPSKRVIDVVTDVAENIQVANGSIISASQFLNHFLFAPGRQQVRATRLSGGEKRRLALLLVLIANPNFLILDEPTNDLDLKTLTALESFLDEFGGCLIIVSHDRFFMDRLCDHLFVFEGKGKIKDYPGNFSQYREEIIDAASQDEKASNEAIKAAKRVKTKKEKLSFKEKRELEELTTELEKLENRKSELEELLNAGGTDFENLSGWGSELQIVIASIDKKTDRWLVLEELSENE